MNVLENVDLLTQETLMHTVNELTLYKKCDRQWEDRFAREGGKVGEQIRIRKATNSDVTYGADFVEQALEDPYTMLSLDYRIQVGFAYTTQEKTLNLDRISERYLLPRARRIANEVDSIIARTMAQAAALFVGTPGTVPTTLDTYHSALTELMDLGVPAEPRDIVQTPLGLQKVVNDLRGLVESGPDVAKQYRTGRVRRVIGADWDIDQNIYRHTTGAVTGSGLVKGANQSGASIITDDWTASTVGILKKGDKLTFPGCYAVNPITGAQLEWLRPFAVTADGDSDGAGECTVAIDPPIILTGPYKNVSASPDNDGGVQLFGHVSTYASKVTPLQLAFHKMSTAVCLVGLERPDAGEKSSYKTDEDAGMSMRFVKWYDGDKDKVKCRFDLLLGVKVVLPDYIAVIAS